MKQGQTGRSMVEMLGVLAIMGIVSVVTFIGFKHILNKHKAYTIISDARIAHHHEMAVLSPHIEWHQLPYAFESHKTIWAMQDKIQQVFIKVDGIEKEICMPLLDMASQGILAFYNPEGGFQTSCEEQNDIVFAFGKIGKIAQCTVLSDCGQDFHGRCTNDYQCQECDPQAETWNNETRLCECDSEKGHLCFDDSENEWCCTKGTICGNSVGICMENCANESDVLCTKEGNKWCCTEGLKCSREIGQCSDGTCWATYRQEEGYEDDLCTLIFSQTAPEKLCQITFSDNSTDIELQQYDSCGQNSYCYVTYTNPERTTPLVPQSAGILYGTCSPLNERDMSGGYTMALDSCSGNRYCYVTYSNPERTTALLGTSTGILYGTCSPLNEHTMSGGYSFTEHTPCAENEYCRLEWRQDTHACPPILANTSINFYGVCLPLSEDEFTCPY